MVELTRAEPVPGFVVVTCTVILWMKLLSYAHCNADFRRACPLCCLFPPAPGMAAVSAACMLPLPRCSATSLTEILRLHKNLYTPGSGQARCI